LKETLMGFELVDCTETMLREIADPQMHRRDVAMTYRLCMESSEPTDWGRVNRAIVERWSKAALVWIKEQAHSGACFKEKKN
jgi:hypothetical protein